jgi:hypothetical protein
MRRRIYPVVRLGLDDDSANAVDEQSHSNQSSRNLRGVSHEVDARQT